MKTRIILIATLISAQFVVAQQIKGITGQTNWLNNWTNFKPTTTEYRESNYILSGKIDKSTTLLKKNVYLLVGTVYVTNNATLTIEPGTVIRGDSKVCGSLVITNGATIIANGSETDPIIFTSNKPVSDRKAGDWGGVIVLGGAPTNKFGSVGYLDFNLDPKLNTYGGDNVESNSGILNYIRIEFAGRKVNSTKEINALSLAGIGRKTKINSIQISYSNDDSFEFYGGDLNVNNLVSFRATDDDYDFTEGTQCNINNSIAIRDPYISDVSKSRCLEIDSYDKPENADLTKKLTKVNANNLTLLSTEDNNEGLIKEAIFIRENSFLNIKNSVISGFNQCVLLDAKIKTFTENLEKITLNDMLFNNCKGYIESEIVDNNKAIKNWYTNDKYLIECSKINSKGLFLERDIKKIPDFRLQNSNIITSRLASN
jgi:hypothetical protein